MERLLILRLQAQGVAAQARLNGFALAEVGAAGGVQALAVHEYTLAGNNRLELVIEPAAPAPEPRLSEGPRTARLQLLLPRVGQAASDDQSRCLATLDWAVQDGELYRAHATVQQEVDIPVKFPRWRWQDAPPLPDLGTLTAPVLAFAQEQALALAQGDAEPWITAARLRFEELALAYQRKPEDDLARWRARVQLLHAQKALRGPLPAADKLKLRPTADGRLIECLSTEGGPLLQFNRPDGGKVSMPMRIAVVEGRLYVLR
ncbi:hypothetical protein ACG04R_25885 [Roseateles sp. BYS78W]|uniref:Uncharacterized protein n=1 Tax=Pelomonas candidula TaxID=3299025 RepID=A0ABW7HJM9_9BURK